MNACASYAEARPRRLKLIASFEEADRHAPAETDERYRMLIGKSAPIRSAMRAARKAAETSATVLLLGETGVGKELLARSIHAWSARAAGPFVPVNCVALAEGLLESELFGHEKGAFTGALQQKKGLLEMAHGGTVFLDEIGDTKPEFQAKLLRALQTHQFERVGDTRPITVDLRIIAATNQDLDVAVREGRFRKDLYYRLNVVSITLPPLRSRTVDIPGLATFFVERYCRELKRPPMTIAPLAMKRMAQYDWPGNIRELENVIKRAVVLAVGIEIGPRDLALGARAPSPALTDSHLDLPFHASVLEHKRVLIARAIAKAGGKKSQAAGLLKLQPTYLFRLCKQLGIP